MAHHEPQISTAPHESLAARLDRHAETLHQRLDALERRLDQRLGELKARQEEDLVLVKAMSCQLRGRVERMERRTRTA